MTRYKHTREDLEARLRESVETMELLSAAFDRGSEGQARPLSAEIRKLVHDTKKSTSLLELLGLKHQLQYADTGHRLDSPMGAWGLWLLNVPAGAYFPPLELRGPPQLMDFDRWWNDAIAGDMKGHKWSRRDFVLAVANKDAGVHIDELPTKHGDLTMGGSLGITVGGPGNDPGVEPKGNPALIAIRQIAFELDRTLRGQVGDLVSR
ncbi:MAG: hypothetical protein ACRDMH_02450 [Solirubrobacterales bacterium]